MKEEKEEEIKYRVCIVCGELKPLTEYHKSKKSKLGRIRICKNCRAIKDKKYREGNREKIREQRHRFYHEHRGELLAKSKEHYRSHREEINAYRDRNRSKLNARKRKYYDENKEELKAKAKKYRDENKDEINAKYKKYYAKNQNKEKARRKEYRDKNKDKIKARKKKYNQTPNGKIVMQRANNVRRAYKASAGGKGISTEQWQQIIKKQGNKCNMCGKKFTKTKLPSMDHIIPLSKGGDHDASNIQALCSPCNSSKNNRIKKEYIQSWAN